MVKKWKDVRWKLWSPELVGATKYEPPSEEEVGQLLDAQDIFLKPENPVEDTRQCILCHDIGDGETNGPARLLNLDVDLWVHLNCALWSQEVYETCDGALMNVANACRRALLVNCSRCHRTGASLHCFRIRCPASFHFACASLEGCSFYKDKTILCPQHTPRVPNIENVLESVAVFRRVYISRDEHKQVASMFHKGGAESPASGQPNFPEHRTAIASPVAELPHTELHIPRGVQGGAHLLEHAQAGCTEPLHMQHS
ncbi:hypothetical protein MRX96_036365 [Rhipicephalus microplus]